jgi:hypothetical protein
MTVPASATAPKTSPETSTTISPRTWLIAGFAALAIALAVNFYIAWKLDIFGILRDTHGRVLRTSRHERQAKYLLNFNYVPQNFDALIIGASSSANWESARLTGYRFYNESLPKADGSEERILVERALKTGKFKVALVGLDTAIGDMHELQDGLGQADPHEALGSFYSYFMMLDIALHPSSIYGADGSHTMPESRPPPPKPFQVYDRIPWDEKAVDDYRALMEELLSRGTRVIYVVYPHYGMDVDGTMGVRSEYIRRLLARLPKAPVIDFYADDLKDFRSNPDNFMDDMHLNAHGSDLLSDYLNRRMHAILKDQ